MLADFKRPRDLHSHGAAEGNSVNVSRTTYFPLITVMDIGQSSFPHVKEHNKATA